MRGGRDGCRHRHPVRRSIEDLADQYRGETVVAVSHGTAMQLALGTAATNTTTRFTFARTVPNCGVADVESTRTAFAC